MYMIQIDNLFVIFIHFNIHTKVNRTLLTILLYGNIITCYIMITFIFQRDQTYLNATSEIANVKREVFHVQMSNVHHKHPLNY